MSVSVSMSVSWNAAFTVQGLKTLEVYRRKPTYGL